MSLPGPPCAHGVSGTLHEEVCDISSSCCKSSMVLDNMEPIIRFLFCSFMSFCILLKQESCDELLGEMSMLMYFLFWLSTLCCYFLRFIHLDASLLSSMFGNWMWMLYHSLIGAISNIWSFLIWCYGCKWSFSCDWFVFIVFCIIF